MLCPVRCVKETTWRIVAIEKKQGTIHVEWHSAESLVITNIDPKTQRGVGRVQLTKIVAAGVH